MAAKLAWENPTTKDLILMTVDGTFTMDDLIADYPRVSAMMDESDAKRVHILVDQRTAKIEGAVVSRMREAYREHPSLNHPQAGDVVTITGDRTVTTFMNIFILTFLRGATFVMVATPQEGIEYYKDKLKRPVAVEWV